MVLLGGDFTTFIVILLLFSEYTSLPFKCCPLVVTAGMEKINIRSVLTSILIDTVDD